MFEGGFCVVSRLDGEENLGPEMFSVVDDARVVYASRSIGETLPRISHLASRISHLASRISHLASRISHLASRISLLAVCAGPGSWPALAEPPGPFDDEPAPLAWIDSGDGVALALTSPGRDAIVRYELFHGALRVSWSEGPLPDLTSVIHAPRAPASALSHPRMRTHVSTLMVRLQSEGRSWRAPAIGVVLEPHADGGWSLRRLPDSDRAEDADPTRFHNRSFMVYDPEVYPTRPGTPVEVAAPEGQDTGLAGGGE